MFARICKVKLRKTSIKGLIVLSITATSINLRKKGSIFFATIFKTTIGKNYLSCVKKRPKKFYAFIEMLNKGKEDFGNRISHDRKIDKFVKSESLLNVKKEKNSIKAKKNFNGSNRETSANNHKLHSLEKIDNFNTHSLIHENPSLTLY